MASGLRTEVGYNSKRRALKALALLPAESYYTEPRMAGWTPRDINRLVITGSASLTLVILIAGVIGLLFLGKIDSSAIGSVRGLATGSGFGVLAALVTQVMKKGLPK
jgi:hypothetical protein